MDILIVGPSGSGKSKLGDLIKSTIFALDKDSKITTNDPDRESKSFGEGKNVYNLEVMQENSIVTNLQSLKYDVVIVLTDNTVSKWFSEVYERR